MNSKGSTATRIAVTAGEPAGIGPDLCVLMAQQARTDEFVCIADPALLLDRAGQLDLPLVIRPFNTNAPGRADAAGELCVMPIELSQTAVCGRLDPRNAGYVLALLDAAVDGCLAGNFGAMVTAPLHKGAINDSGIAFTGHTEYLAERTGAYPVMMLLNERLRVALATTHLPLREVADALTPELLTRVLETLIHDLSFRFGVPEPTVLVCGLNPHAGESGHLGHEEQRVITPVLDSVSQRKDLKARLIGPLPADTLFTPKYLDHADAVLAMYHDQGLPVLKYAGFGESVNLTLGLPIIRTSVDHGTALDLAGSGRIHTGSLQQALDLAVQLVRQQATPDR